MSKKMLVFAGLFAMVSLTMSFAGGQSACGAKKVKFGYALNDMSHEWYQNIAKGARARAAELGGDITIADAAMDAAKQVSQLENMITQGVDVLIITPVDVKSLPNIIAEAARAGQRVMGESESV